MSLSDTAEYWNDVKANRGYSGKNFFLHAKGCQCGHFHVMETRYLNEIDCYACLKIIAEMGNIFNLKEKRIIKTKSRLKQSIKNLSNQQQKDKFAHIKVGDTVSHEDYTSEDFIVTEIDKENNIVYTSGGKNGTWINPIELIIKKPNPM